MINMQKDSEFVKGFKKWFRKLPKKERERISNRAIEVLKNN